LKTNDDGSGGLGGQYGYGSNYESDIFMLHRYCWCEDDNCKWCNGEMPNFLFKPTGARVKWYKYIGRDQKIHGNFPNDWLEQCLESLWDKDECYVEFGETYDEDMGRNVIKITLCFNLFDKNALVKISPNPFFHNLDIIKCWDSNAFFEQLFYNNDFDEKGNKKVDDLRNKYPNLDKKINELALEYNRASIKWHQIRIKAIKDCGIV
jgi:hypothetical protein